MTATYATPTNKATLPDGFVCRRQHYRKNARYADRVLADGDEGAGLDVVVHVVYLLSTAFIRAISSESSKSYSLFYYSPKVDLYECT